MYVCITVSLYLIIYIIFICIFIIIHVYLYVYLHSDICNILFFIFCKYRYSNYRYLSELQEPHTYRNVTPCKKNTWTACLFCGHTTQGKRNKNSWENGSMRSSPVMVHLYVWRTGVLRDSRLDWAKCQRCARKTYCLQIVGSGRNRWWY